MNYTITGDIGRGYEVAFSRVWPTTSTCPCCGKPFDTLRKAFLFAEHMTLLTKEAMK
jgi:hypothetical protein